MAAAVFAVAALAATTGEDSLGEVVEEAVDEDDDRAAEGVRRLNDDVDGGITPEHKDGRRQRASVRFLSIVAPSKKKKPKKKKSTRNIFLSTL